jgi:Zn-dependent M16 (insulinase) family peptidase
VAKKSRNNMSIALSLELQEAVERCAAKRGIKTSALFQDLIKKYVIPNKGVHTIILKIPTELKDDPKALKDWLDARTAVIIKSLTSEPIPEKQE